MATIITAVQGRATTGISVNPFLCATEDGREIYVKPAGTLQRLLVSEWVGGRLAQEMGLPCAEMTLVEIPEIVTTAHKKPEWSDLRAGIGFGSFSMGHRFRDLQFSDIVKLPSDVLAELYVFDYWILNRDRQMGAISGNPNTLVSYDRSEMCIIDHDSAFDTEFDLPLFKNYHLGRRKSELWRDRSYQEEWLSRAAAVLEKLDEIWSELPDSWLYSDLDNTGSPLYTVDSYRETLERPFNEDSQFWGDLIK